MEQVSGLQKDGSSVCLSVSAASFSLLFNEVSVFFPSQPPCSSSISCSRSYLQGICFSAPASVLAPTPNFGGSRLRRRGRRQLASGAFGF